MTVIQWPTKAQRAVLAWLASHPGECVFSYYDRQGTPYFSGLRIVSRRGGAGHMAARLRNAGWIDADEQITDAGREAILVIAPGQLLSNPNATIPLVRVVCRYPFDGKGATPRWVIEHINTTTHAVEIVRESGLVGYDLLVTIPLRAPLDGQGAIA